MSAEGTFDYRKATLLVVALLLLLLGVGGVGTVWLRQARSHVAGSILDLEREQGQIIRKLRYMEAKYAAVHLPENLVSLAGENLHPAQSGQVLWLEGRRMPRVMLASGAREEEPFEVAFDLAFLDEEATGP